MDCPTAAWMQLGPMLQGAQLPIREAGWGGGEFWWPPIDKHNQCLTGFHTGVFAWGRGGGGGLYSDNIMYTKYTLILKFVLPLAVLCITCTCESGGNLARGEIPGTPLSVCNPAPPHYADHAVGQQYQVTKNGQSFKSTCSTVHCDCTEQFMYNLRATTPKATILCIRQDSMQQVQYTCTYICSVLFAAHSCS